MAAARRRRARLRLLLLCAAVALALIVLLRGCGGGTQKPQPFSGKDGDPFAYSASDHARFERRAAVGLAHVLYSRSPGGAEATARRVARYRPLVDAVAAKDGVPADMLEALVFLESAGRPDARAGNDLSGAAGLTQILAETATNLLGMRVDVAASEKLTRGIARGTKVAARKRERRRIDERFDPPKAVAAAGRYLVIAKRTLGRDDLAFESYHMGIGNLQGALRAYGETKIPYAQLFFDSSPLRHPEAWKVLASLGDDSSTYLWRLFAARDIMRLYRGDLAKLRTIAGRQTAKSSAEEVLHPEETTAAFADPSSLALAYSRGTVTALPAAALAKDGITVDAQMGELASQLGQQPGLYRGLRPKALEVLRSIGQATRQIGGGGALVLTSTVRDRRYQRELGGVNAEATNGFSLHTTGYAFDILRSYSSREQAVAFQFVLDRLTALNAIAWLREPKAIHITVAG
ncbi:MAG TPA: transglycosylase SLT domain-containing protein [Solirubrobacteraceae bacterium]|nr:transglycosylase SLT domain-containing protein [Solirubrobacteraceae bacterium]